MLACLQLPQVHLLSIEEGVVMFSLVFSVSDWSEYKRATKSVSPCSGCPHSAGCSRAYLSTLCPGVCSRGTSMLYSIWLLLYFTIFHSITIPLPSMFSLITVRFFSYSRLKESLPQQGWATDRYLALHQQRSPW